MDAPVNMRVGDRASAAESTYRLADSRTNVYRDVEAVASTAPDKSKKR
jgi:hypothetical protein